MGAWAEAASTVRSFRRVLRASARFGRVDVRAVLSSRASPDAGGESRGESGDADGAGTTDNGGEDKSRVRRKLHASDTTAIPMRMLLQQPPSAPLGPTPGGSVDEGSGLLLRDYVHRQLFDNDRGFFSTTPLLRSDGIAFQALKNRAEYDRAVDALYTRTVRQFATPTEVFRPIYGHAVARWLLEGGFDDGRAPLLVVEVGGGNGTLAEDVLSYLEREHPQVYSRCTYTIVEISRQLAQLQRERLAPRLAQGRVAVFEGSVLEWRQRMEEDCAVIALEVLDNMPHDRVEVDDDGNAWQSRVRRRFAESSDRVEQVRKSELRYELESVSDPLLMRTAHYWRAADGARASSASAVEADEWGSVKTLVRAMRRVLDAVMLFGQPTNVEYVPTTAQAFLEMLRDHLPRHRALIADFDFLPRSIGGVNAPVVQRYMAGQRLMYSDILEAYRRPSEVDIFFPTNFAALHNAYTHVCGKSAKVLSHQDFLRQYADHQRTQLRDGSNPMLTDYENMKCLLTVAD